MGSRPTVDPSTCRRAPVREALQWDEVAWVLVDEVDGLGASEDALGHDGLSRQVPESVDRCVPRFVGAIAEREGADEAAEPTEPEHRGLSRLLIDEQARDGQDNRRQGGDRDKDGSQPARNR